MSYYWMAFDNATIVFRGPNGSATAPTFSFTSDTNTGWYRSAADELSATTGGTQAMVIDASQRALIAGGVVTSTTFRLDAHSGDASVVNFTSNTAVATWRFVDHGTDGGQLWIARSRGTRASPTTTASGDTIGDLHFRGYDGTTYVPGGIIRCEVTAAVGTDSLPSALSFRTNDSAATTTERMRILAGGAVIIGNGDTAASPNAATLRGTDGSGTNVAGAAVIARPGLSTGNADAGLYRIQGGANSTTSGSTLQTSIDRAVFGPHQTLTDGSATNLISCTIASGSAIGGWIAYTIEATDGTDYQAESGMALYSANNKAGTVSATITELSSQQNLSAGTLASTWAISAANPAVISLNADTSLTASTGYPRVTFAVFNFGQQAIAISA